MAKIAFILLCHKDPDAIIKQAQSLTAVGDYVSIHYDARAPRAAFQKLRSALGDNPNVTFPRKRKRCGWGEWSLVEATLLALTAAVEAFPRATHFYMLSGDCMAIKSARYAHDFLDRRDCDYIESFDYFRSGWIKTGWREERLVYRHLVNERERKRLFYALFNLQKWFGLQRKIPEELEMMIGSQWWCLRRRTVEWVLKFTRKRRDIVRFFKTTWIPDETYFQTIVRHLVPEHEIQSRTLTFLMFSDYGMPVVFYNDHYDLLLAQDCLFARKISPGAKDLKRRLGVLYSAEEARFQVSNEGRELYTFLTEKGRIGHRFAKRFWETESTLGRERELMIVLCKKWHIAKRLVERIRLMTNIPCIEFLFNEEDCPLPDLGGIESTMKKRNGHRRALMRMLFDYYENDRMLICLDPGSFELLEDFARDRATTRILDVDCQFTDDYLIGHAKRIGLAGDHTPIDSIIRLLPTMRNDLNGERDRIRDAGYAHLLHLRETNTVEANVQVLSEFLSLPHDKACEIARNDHLFAD